MTEWKAFYVSKGSLTDLKVLISNTNVKNAANEYNRTEEDIKKMVGYNGGGGFLVKLSDKKKKNAEVHLSVRDAGMALELATAEIERTKEALVEKNETTERDRKLARRRELYAAKKNSKVTTS